jgi:hypothetical protein
MVRGWPNNNHNVAIAAYLIATVADLALQMPSAALARLQPTDPRSVFTHVMGSRAAAVGGFARGPSSGCDCRLVNSAQRRRGAGRLGIESTPFPLTSFPPAIPAGWAAMPLAARPSRHLRTTDGTCLRA